MSKIKGGKEERGTDETANEQHRPATPPLPLSPSPPLSFSPSPTLPTAAILIGCVSLMSDISGEMIYPLLPIFITQTLAAPASAVGLIEGIAVGTASIVGGVSGYISDRIGRRKPVAFFGYLLTALSRPMIALAGAWPVVLGARFAERFGKGIRNAPRDALLADSVTAEQRGRAFGFERAMDSAGAVLGPLVGLALFAWLALDLRYIFMISAIPATIAALLILAVRERPHESSGGAPPGFSLAGATPAYRRLLLITVVFGLANSANSFLILRGEQLMGTGRAILAYALYNLVSTLAALPAGVASDRFGRRDLLIVGYMVYALSYAGFGLNDSAWAVWPLFALYGLFPALTDGVAKAMIVDTAGAMGRATAIGIYSAVVGVTQIIASYAAGLLWDHVDWRATFYMGAALAALAVALLVGLFPSSEVRSFRRRNS